MRLEARHFFTGVLHRVRDPLTRGQQQEDELESKSHRVGHWQPSSGAQASSAVLRLSWQQGARSSARRSSAQISRSGATSRRGALAAGEAAVDAAAADSTAHRSAVRLEALSDRAGRPVEAATDGRRARRGHGTHTARGTRLTTAGRALCSAWREVNPFAVETDSPAGVDAAWREPPVSIRAVRFDSPGWAAAAIFVQKEALAAVVPAATGARNEEKK